MTYMAVVESWWNGTHAGMARHRVRLRDDGGRWSVEHDGPQEAHTTTPCADERQARAELRRQLLAAGASLDDDGRVAPPWKRVDQLTRGHDAQTG